MAMGWGAMIGLGQGMQQFSKTMMDDELTKRREARAEELEQRREQRRAERERTTPKDKNYVERDGVWFEQTLGGDMNVLEERLAPENKVREFRAEQEDRQRKIEADAMKLRADTARVGISERQLADYDSDRNWERSIKERELGIRERAAANRGRGLDSDDVEFTEEEEIAFLADQHKDTFNSIVRRFENKDDPSAGPSPTDLNTLTRRAVRDARAQGKNPNAYMANLLTIYEQKLRERAPRASTTPPSGTGIRRSLAN